MSAYKLFNALYLDITRNVVAALLKSFVVMQCIIATQFARDLWYLPDPQVVLISGLFLQVLTTALKEVVVNTFPQSFL